MSNSFTYKVYDKNNRVLSEWPTEQQAIHAAKEVGAKYVVRCATKVFPASYNNYDPYNNEKDLLDEVGECDSNGLL